MDIFLVSRTDRIGDLVLTLPIFSEIRKNCPNAKIIAHVRGYTAPLLENRPDVDEIIIDDSGPVLTNLGLARLFKRKGVSFAVIAHPTFRALFGARFSGASRVVGRASNIWQFLLTKRLVQKRSRNEKHELDYNLDLAAPFFGEIPRSLPVVFLTEAEREKGRETIRSLGFGEEPPVILHPGHGGSAFNLSPGKYLELAETISNSGFPVCISIGPQEMKFRETFGKFALLPASANIRGLAAILGNAKAFISGSTGPMHVAGALGTPVIAFFPPVFAMSPVRWGPLGSKKLVVSPDLPALRPDRPKQTADGQGPKQRITCSGACKKCMHIGCMDKIDFESVKKWLSSLYKS